MISLSLSFTVSLCCSIFNLNVISPLPVLLSSKKKCATCFALPDRLETRFFKKKQHEFHKLFENFFQAVKTAPFYLFFVRNSSTLKTTPRFQEVNENGNSIFFFVFFLSNEVKTFFSIAN